MITKAGRSAALSCSNGWWNIHKTAIWQGLEPMALQFGWHLIMSFVDCSCSLNLVEKKCLCFNLLSSSHLKENKWLYKSRHPRQQRLVSQTMAERDTWLQAHQEAALLNQLNCGEWMFSKWQSLKSQCTYRLNIPICLDSFKNYSL